MTICPLEKAMNEYNKKENEIKTCINVTHGLISKWYKSNKSYYILSECVKDQGYQLTFFIDNEPISDMIRDTFNHNDFIHELVLNDCSLETFNYIYK